jgi:hypothetical protein
VPAVAWREGSVLSGDWVAEVSIRFPGGVPGPAGIAIRSADGIAQALIDPVERRCAAQAADREAAARPLPELGDEPFNPAAFHALEVRARGGRAEVRIDGVLILDDLALPRGAAELGLVAVGAAAFDALCVMVGRGSVT